MPPDLVTAYYLCHGHWTVIPHQLEENFRDMRECGFTAVAFSFSESEMRYSRRAFELQVGLAKKFGLRCLVIPSRLGGRFAGAPLMPSWWLASHPECIVPESTSWPVACIECQEFVDWITEFMTILITDYELDGIIWDEPKGVDLISSHPDTRACLGESPTSEDMQHSFVQFLSELTAHCLSLRPEMVITLFLQATNPVYFTEQAARIQGLTYFGYDGNLARQSFFHEEPEWHKYRIESVWSRTQEECKSGGKSTFALVENMLMPAAAMVEYESNLGRYLATHYPDHLALYYYAHNNEDPENVHSITRRLMQEHFRGPFQWEPFS